MPHQPLSNNSFSESIRFSIGLSDNDDDNSSLNQSCQCSQCDAKDIVIRDLKIENREFQNKLQEMKKRVVSPELEKGDERQNTYFPKTRPRVHFADYVSEYIYLVKELEAFQIKSTFYGAKILLFILSQYCQC
ncbi:Hypothetical predicted protein [Mytilus galloprovincialis]|uniref:Uncharacterized protein n=1 Tax=Mytilus galloprovincialis TaxID=29158 RepID=A0A8B6HAS8_MYTGA|nr:Hypothetical predicted protein [Mytilus galloprovincialis]